MIFSLGLETPGYMRNHDEYIIRAIMTWETDVTTGSITIPTEVLEGTSIRVMHRDYEKLANGVDRVAKEIKAQLGDNPARLVFQFDCTGRGKVFLREQQKLQLLETLRKQIGPDVPWLGFYTYGEIVPVGGYNCLHNFTVALTAIY
jgi:small ligand-binding sensory domain FIST